MPFLSGKKNPKIHIEVQWLFRNSRTILETKSWKIHTSQTYYFKTFQKAKIIKMVCCWHKDRHTDQRNRTESPEINANTYANLSPIKVPRPSNGERRVSSTNGGGTTG